jgi:type II secretory pathway component PulM
MGESRCGELVGLSLESGRGGRVRKFLAAVGLILTLVALYLLIWPVPVKPVAWQAPVAPNYVRPFAWNDRLKGLETLPKAVALGSEPLKNIAEAVDIHHILGPVSQD